MTLIKRHALQFVKTREKSISLTPGVVEGGALEPLALANGALQNAARSEVEAAQIEVLAQNPRHLRFAAALQTVRTARNNNSVTPDPAWTCSVEQSFAKAEGIQIRKQECWRTSAKCIQQQLMSDPRAGVVNQPGQLVCEFGPSVDLAHRW